MPSSARLWESRAGRSDFPSGLNQRILSATHWLKHLRPFEREWLPLAASACRTDKWRTRRRFSTRFERNSRHSNVKRALACPLVLRFFACYFCDARSSLVFNRQRSSKKSASAILPGQTELGGVVRSTTAQSGS